MAALGAEGNGVVATLGAGGGDGRGSREAWASERRQPGFVPDCQGPRCGV